MVLVEPATRCAVTRQTPQPAHRPHTTPARLPAPHSPLPHHTRLIVLPNSVLIPRACYAGTPGHTHTTYAHAILPHPHTYHTRCFHHTLPTPALPRLPTYRAHTHTLPHLPAVPYTPTPTTYISHFHFNAGDMPRPRFTFAYQPVCRPSGTSTAFWPRYRAFPRRSSTAGAWRWACQRANQLMQALPRHKRADIICWTPHGPLVPVHFVIGSNQPRALAALRCRWYRGCSPTFMTRTRYATRHLAYLSLRGGDARI